MYRYPSLVLWWLREGSTRCEKVQTLIAKFNILAKKTQHAEIETLLVEFRHMVDKMDKFQTITKEDISIHCRETLPSMALALRALDKKVCAPELKIVDVGFDALYHWAKLLSDVYERITCEKETILVFAPLQNILQSTR